MPKSKKKKNADFQKVKLKVGKRLPKGGNETNISFKSRTLKVTQTIKDHSKIGNQPQTKRKLTLEELIKQCSANKSCSQRLSAVEGFKELLLSDAGKAAMLSRLPQVMERVSGLLADPEHTVRHAVLRLCRTLFTVIGSDHHSFFDYMSAQLCCTMNNISDDVRKDALTLFDMLLEKFPQQVIGPYSNLVPTLIGQISSQMMSGGKVMTLVCNPNSRLSSQQWRAEVLQRLRTIVETFVEKHREVEALADDEAEVFRSGDQFPVVRLPTARPCVRKMWTDPYRQKYEQRFSATRQEYGDLTRNEDCLQKFISSLLPLVKQCWIEEHCSDGTAVGIHGTSHAGQLTEKALPMVKCLVGLLHAFVECWHCVYTYNNKTLNKNSWFQGEFLQYLKELLLPKFPIYIVEKAHKDSKGISGKQSAVKVSVLKMNLQVCETLAGLCLGNETRPNTDMSAGELWQKDVVNFLLKNLKLCGGPELSKQVTCVLRKVFLGFNSSERVEKLLQKTQKRFVKAHPQSTEKRVYLDLLDDLAFDQQQESPYNAIYHTKHKQLEPYFQALPGLLLSLCGLKNAESLACHIARCLCHYTSKELSTSMHQNMTKILDVETGVFSSLPESCHGNMVSAIRWTYHDWPVPEDILERVELVCRLPQVSKETADALVSGLHSKYADLFRRKLFVEQKNDYLRFFLSVLVGHKRVELESFAADSNAKAGGLTHILWSSTAQQMEKHDFIVKRCVQNFHPYLESLTKLYGTQVMEVMADTWTNKILIKYHVLSVFTAYAAMAHWMRMVRPLTSYGDFIHFNAAPVPAPIRGEQNVKMMERHLGELLPCFKAKMRPFTKLAFSVAVSVVSLETSQEMIVADAAVVRLMWETVVEMMKLSFRQFLDLCKVAADFVEGEKSPEQSMKAVIVVTRLLRSEELLDLICFHQDCVKSKLEELVTAVKKTTPNVEDRPWWQEFLKVSS